MGWDFNTRAVEGKRHKYGSANKSGDLCGSYSVTLYRMQDRMIT
jgi:hypothetical protein